MNHLFSLLSAVVNSAIRVDYNLGNYANIVLHFLFEFSINSEVFGYLKDSLQLDSNKITIIKLGQHLTSLVCIIILAVCVVFTEYITLHLPSHSLVPRAH